MGEDAVLEEKGAPGAEEAAAEESAEASEAEAADAAAEDETAVAEGDDAEAGAGAAEAEAEAEQSADDLKAEIEALKAENAKLKETEQTEGEDKAKPGVTAQDKPKAMDFFVKRFIPDAKKAFTEAAKQAITVSEDGTVTVNQKALDAQFDTMVTTTDRFMSSVFYDKQDPINRGLGQSVIDLSNDLELAGMRISADGTVNKKLLGLEATIRKELAKMAWDKRAEPGVVKGIYHRLIGSTQEAAVSAKPVAKKPVATQSVKDAAAGAGGGTGRRPAVTVTLTAEQEAERKEMEEEAGHPVTAQAYKAKLDARNLIRKQKGQPPIKTLKSTT